MIWVHKNIDQIWSNFIYVLEFIPEIYDPEEAKYGWTR